MGENETIEVKAPAAPVAVTSALPAPKATASKAKKKDKRLTATPDAVPHMTGRLLHVEIGAKNVEFAIKGKKGKAETFSLKSMDPTAIPAAAAMLAGLLESKTKLRVEFATSGDVRTISKIRAHN